MSLICLLTLWKLLRIGSLVGVALSSSSPLLFTTTLSLLDDISLPATGIFSFSHSLMDWLLASFFTPSIPANVLVRIDGRVAARGEGELLPLQRKSGFPPRKPPPGNFLTREKGAADVYLYIISSATVELLNVGTSQTCRCCTWGVACWSAPRSGRFETSRHKWKDASSTWRLRIQNWNIIHSENSRKLKLICFEKTRTQFPQYEEAFCRNSRVVFSSFFTICTFPDPGYSTTFSTIILHFAGILGLCLVIAAVALSLRHKPPLYLSPRDCLLCVSSRWYNLFHHMIISANIYWYILCKIFTNPALFIPQRLPSSVSLNVSCCETKYIYPQRLPAVHVQYDNISKHQNISEYIQHQIYNTLRHIISNTTFIPTACCSVNSGDRISDCPVKRPRMNSLNCQLVQVPGLSFLTYFLLIRAEQSHSASASSAPQSDSLAQLFELQVSSAQPGPWTQLADTPQ